MKRSQFWWAAAVFAALVLISPPTALGQRSPCPDIFSYKRDEYGVLFGELQIPNVSFGSHNIRVDLSIKSTKRHISTDNGEILLQDQNGVYLKVRNGEPITYTVQFPDQSPLPKVILVTYDDQTLCEGPKEKFSGLRVEYIAQLSLESTLTVTQGSQNTAPARKKPYFANPNTVSNRFGARPRPTPTTTPRPTRKPTSKPDLSYHSPYFPCGIPQFSAAANFVVNGMRTLPGQWPWLVTVNLKRNREYQCTGTLVSPSVVITAGHCVFFRATKRRADEMLLEFGVYDRINDRGNIVQKYVSSIELPRGHTVKSPPIHDLAALVTKGPVTYSNIIIPVCLWSGDRGLKKIIDLKEPGTVVGWGNDELDNDATVDPRSIKVPIIPFKTCTRSHSFFNNLAKGHQYCAGAADGRSSVCNGDSGGGMFFYRNNHWELKGVVSFGVNTAKHTCDLNEYVVFTDVTLPEYGSWLERIIETQPVEAEVEEDY